MPMHLVIADDHPIILDGLENLFSLEEDFKVQARCTDGNAALDAVRLHRPHILLLDIRIPGKNGLEVARQIQIEKLPTRVVILTAEIEEKVLLELIQYGVQGIVLKEMAPQLLLQCLRKVHSGQQWIERSAIRKAFENMHSREAGAREISALLTPREIEIVRLVVNGLRNREIALKLFISEGTVKIHLHNIYEKLKVTSRMTLLRLAQEKGLV